MESSPGIVMKPSLIKEPVQYIEIKKCLAIISHVVAINNY